MFFLSAKACVKVAMNAVQSSGFEMAQFEKWVPLVCVDYLHDPEA